MALRRPLARRAEDIGAWSGILQMLTFLSVVTNVGFNNINNETFIKKIIIYNIIVVKILI